MELEFARQIFEKILKYANFMKILPLGPALFHAVERTDIHDDANGGFSQFCEKRQKPPFCSPTMRSYDSRDIRTGQRVFL